MGWRNHQRMGQAAEGDAESVVLELQDGEKLGFGGTTGGDVFMRWDGSIFECLPETDDTGAFNIGDGTYDMDFKVFMGSTTAHVLFDNSAQLVTFTGTRIAMGAQGTGVPTATASPFGLEVHAKTNTDAVLTAGDSGLSAGIRCRYEIAKAQTNNISLVGVEGRLRVKAGVADGNHAGVMGTIEADAAMPFTGTATTQRSAGAFAIELGSTCTFGSTSGWLCGVAIDSSVHATQTGMANITFAGLRIKTSTSKLPWQYGIYMAGVVRGYYISADLGTMDGEMHGESLALTGTLTSGDSIVGKNIAVTTAGTAGAWAAGIFAKVTQGSTKNVNGYICGAEFEVVNTAAAVSDWFPLVLNGNSSGNGSHTSYIALRDYGTADIPSLFWAPENAIRTTTDGVFCSTVTADPACTHVVRCIVGTTTLYLMATTDTPAN